MDQDTEMHDENGASESTMAFAAADQQQSQEVVQIIMDPGEMGNMDLSDAQIIQLDTGQGQVQQYLQVTGPDGAKQLIRMDAGQMHLVLQSQETEVPESNSSNSRSEQLLQIPPEPPAQLTEEEPPAVLMQADTSVVVHYKDDEPMSSTQEDDTANVEPVIVLPKVSAG